MLSEQTYTEPQWASLSSHVLEGGYELEELIAADSTRAKFRVRVLGGNGQEAFAEMYRGDEAAAQEQVAIWEKVRALEHPNLDRPVAVGETELDGAAVIYYVSRKPDETLNGVLVERALAPQEAGEVLLSVAGALEHLSQNGFAHGCVSPEQIFAVGDSIHLSTLCVRRAALEPAIETVKPKYVAPETSGVNIGPAADVWCLGATLFEILTQRPCSFGCIEEAKKLPGVWSRIVERCLTADPQARCNIAEAMALFQGKFAVGQAAGALAALPELARIPEISRAPQTASPDKTAHPAAVPGKPIAVPQQRSAKSPLVRSDSRIWIYAGLSVLLVLLVVWAARPKETAAPAGTAQKHETAVPSGAWQTRTLTPDEKPSKTPPSVPAARVETVPRRSVPAAADIATVKGPVWRLVLFTYNRPEDAEKKVRTLNGKHPDLQAQVFSPNGHEGPYLVTAGGNMDRESAAGLRQKAIAAGMPRDSYIQNYRR